MHIRQDLSLVTLISVAYFGVFAATFWVLMPLQALLASPYLPFAQATCLVALTHGVRVLATWLLRWKAVVFLLPGTLAEATILKIHFGLPPQDLALMALAFATNSFIAFEFFRLLGRDAYAVAHRPANWRALLLVGVLAAMINAAFLAQLSIGIADLLVRIWLAANAVLGGTLGLISSLLILRIALRVFAKTLLRAQRIP